MASLKSDLSLSVTSCMAFSHEEVILPATKKSFCPPQRSHFARHKEVILPVTKKSFCPSQRSHFARHKEIILPATKKSPSSAQVWQPTPLWTMTQQKSAVSSRWQDTDLKSKSVMRGKRVKDYVHTFFFFLNDLHRYEGHVSVTCYRSHDT